MFEQGDQKMKGICRLCGKIKCSLIDMLSPEGERYYLFVKIRAYINIEVSERDPFPKSVCMLCLGMLDYTCQFQDTCRNAQIFFRKHEVFDSEKDRMTSEYLRKHSDRIEVSLTGLDSSSSTFKDSSDVDSRSASPVFIDISKENGNVSIDKDDEYILWTNRSGVVREQYSSDPSQIEQVDCCDAMISTIRLASPFEINPQDNVMSLTKNKHKLESENNKVSVASDSLTTTTRSKMPENNLSVICMLHSSPSLNEVRETNFTKSQLSPNVVQSVASSSHLPDVVRVPVASEILFSHVSSSSSPLTPDTSENVPTALKSGSSLQITKEVDSASSTFPLTLTLHSSKPAQSDSSLASVTPLDQHFDHSVSTQESDHINGESSAQTMMDSHDASIPAQIVSPTKYVALEFPNVATAVQSRTPTARENDGELDSSYVKGPQTCCQSSSCPLPSNLNLSSSDYCEDSAYEWKKFSVGGTFESDDNRLGCIYPETLLSFLRHTQQLTRGTTQLGLLPKCCPSCGARATNNFTCINKFLVDHLTVYCHECNQIFAKRQKDFVDKLFYGCSTCDQKFDRFSKLCQHISSHKTDNVFCDFCKKSFVCKAYLEKHIRTVHLKIKNYRCSVCVKTFFQKQRLNSHLLKYHGTTIYKCPICGKSMYSQRLLSSHMKENHNMKKPKRKKGRWRNHVKCKECGSTFKHQYQLQLHQMEHTGKKDSFFCDFCSKECTLKKDLTRHIMNVHLNNRNHKCIVCDETFRQRSALRDHMSRHDKTPMYMCSVCGMLRYTLRSLDKHMIIKHNTEKPHKCNECNSAFKTKNSLVLHKLVHTGEKPFCCDQCGKSFARLFTFNIHMKCMHMPKSITCLHCPKMFSHKSNLKTHLKTHKECNLDQRT